MSTTSWQGIAALSTALPVLCCIAVVLRFYARLKAQADLKFDDWAQIPSLFKPKLLFIGMSIACLIGVAHKAIGYPDPPGAPVKTAASTILCQKIVFALQIIQLLDLSIIKCSALAFYRRVFCTVKPSVLNTIIWILIALTSTWCLAFIGFYTASCGTTFDAAWEGDIPFLEHCIILTPKFEKAFAASDFILDTLVLAVPLPSIWKLRMSPGRKIGVTGIFMLALIGYGACTARLARIVLLANATFTQAAPDIQLADTEAIWFSMLETGFTLIAVNLPSLWSIITKVSPDAIIRSIRSLISLGSFQSDHDSRGQSNHTRSYPRKNSASSNQDIALVPQGSGVDLNITIDRQELNKYEDSSRYERGIESGIHVKQSVKMESTEAL